MLLSTARLSNTMNLMFHLCQSTTSRIHKMRVYSILCRSHHCLISVKKYRNPKHSQGFQTQSTDSNQNTPTMSYFVIGVSGVTCGGKTTMSKLLQRSFPWSRIIHQDKYFYPEDYAGHVRLPEINNHINFDCASAMDMKQMHRDVEKILTTTIATNDTAPISINSELTPNFADGLELLRNLKDLDLDTSRCSNIPLLIIEGFTIFESQDLYDKCDIRFFLTLDEETCRLRRSLRLFDPPDGEGYFDFCIWPEYQKHFTEFVKDRHGIYCLSGKTQIGTLWQSTVNLILQRIEERFPTSKQAIVKYQID